MEGKWYQAIFFYTIFEAPQKNISIY